MTNKTFTDRLLTDFAKGYQPFGHVNERIMPVRRVNSNSGKLADYKGDNIRLVSSYKSDDGETGVVRMTESIGSGWLLEKHALKAFASDEQAANEERPFDVRRDRAALCMDLLSIQREFALSGFMGTSSNLSNKQTLAGTDQWGGTTATEIEDIETAIASVQDSAAVPTEMVSLVFQRQVIRKWLGVEKVQSFLFGDNNNKQTNPNQKMLDRIAASFGVKEVIVADGYYNSNANPGGTPTITPLWGKNVFAMLIGDRQNSGIKTQPFGWTMKDRNGPVSDRWRDEDREGWWIRCKDKYDQLIVNETSAYGIYAAIA